jgi:hypothetical protein
VYFLNADPDKPEHADGEAGTRPVFRAGPPLASPDRPTPYTHGDPLFAEFLGVAPVGPVVTAG